MRSSKLLRTASPLILKPNLPAPSRAISTYFVTTMGEGNEFRKILEDRRKKFNSRYKDLSENIHLIDGREKLRRGIKKDPTSLFFIYDHGGAAMYDHITGLGYGSDLIKEICDFNGGFAIAVNLSCMSAALFRTKLDINAFILAPTEDKGIITTRLLKHNLDIVFDSLAKEKSAMETCAQLMLKSPDMMYAKYPGSPVQKANMVGNFTLDEIEDILKETVIPAEISAKIMAALSSRKNSFFLPKTDFTITAIRIILKSNKIEFPQEFQNLLEERLQEKLSLPNFLKHQRERTEIIFPGIALDDRELEEHKGQPTRPLLTSLSSVLLSRRDTEDSIKALAKVFPELLNLRNESGFSPLGLAIQFSSINIVKAWIDLGVDLDKVLVDKDGNEETALQLATKCKKVGAVRLLTEKGLSADYINKKDSQGNNALMNAIIKNDREIVLYLLPLSDLQITNNEGQNALQLAKECGIKEKTLGLYDGIFELVKFACSKAIPNVSPDKPVAAKVQLEVLQDHQIS